MSDLPQTSSSTGAHYLPPPQHHEFEQLCALAFTGELTDEEHARLAAHIEYCDECRSILIDFRTVTTQVMPAIGAGLHPDDPLDERAAAFDVAAGRRRLLEDVEKQEANHLAAKRLATQRKLIVTLVVLTASLALFGAAVALEDHLQRESRLAAVPLVPAPKAAEPLRAESKVPSPPDPELTSEIARLRAQLSQSTSAQSELREQLTLLTSRLEDAQRNESQTQEEKAQLQKQIDTSQAELASLQQSTLAAENARTQMEQTERERRSLQASLTEKDRLIANDADLLSHDRDIRDLIGARDLLIAEIYDVGQDGHRNRPFGRIFYTKDKSLIFYGYDLDKQPGMKKAVAFQAWGSRDNGHDVSLGLFYQDDSSRRWVLKFNDPTMLARLRSVFVTVEPVGGSDKPTGKPLLSASLRIDANHP